MNRTALLAFLLLLPGLAVAGEPGPTDSGTEAGTVVHLTVDEAVARALAASPRLARLGALRTAAEAGERGARAERWPQVDLGAGYQRRSAVPELQIVAPTEDPSMPVQRVTIFPNIQDNYRLRAGVALPLYTGGRVASQIEASVQDRAAAEQDVRAARDDLVLEVKTAYWSLVTAREAVRVLQEAIRAFDAHLEDTRNRVRFGLAARNDLLAVQVERDRAELNRLRAAAAADVAQANLQRLLGLPPDASVETTEEIGTDTVPRPDVEALVSEAGEARPDRAALVARAAAAEAFTGVPRGARLPQLSLTGGYTYANPNRDIVPPEATWKDTWDVGVSLSWSVFDGGRRSADEARAQARAVAVREQLRELDRAIRLEVTQRALELRTAEAQLEVAERGLESATENRRVAAERYREGVIPSSELLDAEVALERASLSLTEARAAVRLAAAGLDRAVGR